MKDDDLYLLSKETFAVFDPLGTEAVALLAKAAFVEAVSTEPVELRRAIEDVNRAACRAVMADTRLRGGGCTMAALHVAETTATVAWVGDVRVCRLRDGRLQQLTTRHTLRNDLVRRGALTADDPALESEPNNVIVRAIGMADAEVDTVSTDVRPDDLYILTSDAFDDAVGEGLFRATLERHKDDLAVCARALLAEAVAAHAPDHITVVLVRIGPTTETGAACEVRATGSD